MADLLTQVLNLIYLIYKSITTDVFVLVLALLPVISTYVIGVKSNKLQYKRYEDNVDNNRTKEYVKRTMYLHDYQVLSLSVAENVMMGEVSESEREKIVEALKNSSAYEKVQSLKYGIDTTCLCLAMFFI